MKLELTVSLFYRVEHNIYSNVKLILQIIKKNILILKQKGEFISITFSLLLKNPKKSTNCLHKLQKMCLLIRNVIDTHEYRTFTHDLSFINVFTKTNF